MTKKLGLTPVGKCETIETLLKDSEFLKSQANNPFVKKLMKEFIFPDAAAALGAYNAQAIEAARYAAIAREACWVVPTDQPKVRFPKFTAGKATKRAAGAGPMILGTAATYVDVSVNNYDWNAAQEWDRATLEDTPGGVLSRVGPQLVQDVYHLENVEYIAALAGIAAGDLAGGATQSPATGNKFVYADVLTLLGALWGVGWAPGLPSVCVLNPAQATDALLNDQAFINGNYLTAGIDKQTAAIGAIFNVKFLVSPHVTAGTVYLHTWFAVGMPLRRDVVLDAYELERAIGAGAVASSRGGFGILQSTAVAKMTGA